MAWKISVISFLSFIFFPKHNLQNLIFCCCTDFFLNLLKKIVFLNQTLMNIFKFNYIFTQMIYNSGRSVHNITLANLSNSSFWKYLNLNMLFYTLPS